MTTSRAAARRKYQSILEALGVPEHVKRHCLAVGDAAANIAAALLAADGLMTGVDSPIKSANDRGGKSANDGGLSGQIDWDTVLAAGYLHDMARAHKDHDTLGAEMMRGADFARFDMDDDLRAAAASVIAGHMKLDFPEHAAEMNTAAVVSLADRVVNQDRYVGYAARMEDLLRRYQGNEEVEARVHRNMEKALRLIDEIEALTGKSLREIATGGRVDIEGVLLRAERPGRYIGGEVNSIVKDWKDTAFHFCFAFPDLYDIGMSYTGFQILYGLMNERADCLCERVFAPATDMTALMEAEGLPLFSLENRMPIRRFDMVGFTLQYELCYTNVVRMLKQAGIPLYAADRSANDPIVVAGGPCAANAEPVAPFFDLVCVGDGEEVMPALADLYIANHTRDREAFLREASKITGVYAPGFYEPVYAGSRVKPGMTIGEESGMTIGDESGMTIGDESGMTIGEKSGMTIGEESGMTTSDESGMTTFVGYEKKFANLPDRIERAAVADLETAYFPVAPVTAHIETVHDRAAVEIMRGCYRKCRFCQASYACAGVRKRSPERIKDLLFKTLANTGYDEVSLLSLSTGDYPGIETLVTELMEELAGQDVSLSLPSLRLDSLKTETLAKIAEYKRSGLTFAPEAGTQRLRDVIGKQITEEDLLHALEIALPLGFTKFKFYFMIGLPTETFEDLDGIARLAQITIQKAKQIVREQGVPYRFNLSVSASNFVPKPGTPLERARGDSEETLIEKVRYLKDAVRRVKGAGFKFHDTRMSRIEMLLAKGDRRVAEAVRIAAEKGAGFDSWREYFDYNIWLHAFEEAGLPAMDLYAETPGDGGEQALPWDLIVPGKAYAGSVK
ncbi:MAG: radical SAM protein [Clostridiales Family XIII bacterium]|jgi:radical SAM superfamily enzyme YgiQ (UPF0313 family)|nr:radical SAM protein [Clostridiales Family XIII bacterium]